MPRAAISSTLVLSTFFASCLRAPAAAFVRDFICSSPEEYPSYDPGGDARQDFQPCESDCGYLGGVNISMRVTFSDIVKLRAAYGDFDVLSEQGYAGHTAEEWGVSDNSPIGGWNICSRDKTQYGYLEHVCLFDASTTGASDGFIDGLPYRTEELDRDNAQYGGTSPTVALFEGNWELRIAFKGFTLTSNFDVAYPAVGGYAKERGRGRPPGFRARVLGISRRSLLARARSYFQFEVENCGDDDGFYLYDDERILRLLPRRLLLTTTTTTTTPTTNC